MQPVSLSLSLSIRHRLSYTQGAEWGTGGCCQTNRGANTRMQLFLH